MVRQLTVNQPYMGSNPITPKLFYYIRILRCVLVRGVAKW